ncbi:MAG: DNA repair protein RecO, partial [Candidatus Paceibacterota bacterium]
MHHIYHTEGIILGSRNHGEAGKIFFIFTRDLGLIYASAAGVRKMSSKLRFVLQDFAHLKVDLVRGRDFWRVTSASKTDTLEQITQNKLALAVYMSVARLLKRLLAGEDPNEVLFMDVVQGLGVLEKTQSAEEARNIEIVLVLRILSNLGYIGGGDALEDLIKSPFESALAFEVAKSRSVILSHINKALRETHL